MSDTLDVSSGVITVTPDGVDPVDSADMTPVTASTTDTGEANAAALDLGTHCRHVDVFFDVTASATVTIKVSNDGATWRTFHEEALDDYATDVLQFETSHRPCRARCDANLETLDLSVKGAE